LASATAALAVGFQVQGYVSEAWDKYSFELNTEATMTRLWFTLPARSSITVAAQPDTGSVVSSSLTVGASLDLRVPGHYTITVMRDSGQGQWTCRSIQGDPVLVKFDGWADTSHFARIVITTEADKETWQFTYPSEATFLVRQINAAGKVTDEQDLSDSDKVDLIAGGTFTMEVAPSDGEGEFTATKTE
jgi:hypothetical protein